MAEERKEPTIKTLKDKGTKIDFADFGDGKQAFVYREERFMGVEVLGVRLGLSEKYKIITPSELTMGTISTLSKQVTNVSGLVAKPEDFEVRVVEEKGHGEDKAHVEKKP